MKVSGSSSLLAANSLFGSYFKEIRAQRQQNFKQSGSNDEATRVSINELRTGLTRLADKLSKLRGLDSTTTLNSSDADDVTGAEGADGSDPVTENPPPPSGPASISLSVENSNKPRKFEQQIGRAFRRGFESEDDKLLKNSNLRGDVVVSVRRGDEVKNVRVSVDGNTTVGDFVNQINAQAGGDVTASFREVTRKGETRLRVALTANEPPPAEEPETPPAENPGIIIGDGVGFRIGDPGEAADLERQLKGVVKAFNQLADLIRSGGQDGQGLETTSVDENLLNTIERAFTDSRSKDGRLSFDSFLTVRKDGLITLSSNSFQQTFLEDPDGVIDVLNSAADTVAGPRGIARDFNLTGGKFDRALLAIQVKQAKSVAQAAEEPKAQESTQSSVKTELAFASRLRSVA